MIQKQISNHTINEDARERLLAAAEKLFSRKGFEGTTIRDITREAGCNVAAVNYHFQSKESLYIEMFRQVIMPVMEIRVRSVEAVLCEKSVPTIEDILRAFSKAFFEPFKDRTKAGQLLSLINREMNDPRLPEGMFYNDILKPQANALERAFKLTCPGVLRPQIYMCVHSFVAQLIHVFRMEQMITKIPGAVMEEFKDADYVDHIIHFTAAGIKAYQNQGDQ